MTRKERERELRRRKALKLWGENCTRAEIGQLLDVSERTVARDLQYWLIKGGYNSLVMAYVSIFVPDEFAMITLLNNQVKDLTRNIKKNLWT